MPPSVPQCAQQQAGHTAAKRHADDERAKSFSASMPAMILSRYHALAFATIDDARDITTTMPSHGARSTYSVHAILARSGRWRRPRRRARTRHYCFRIASRRGCRRSAATPRYCSSVSIIGSPAPMTLSTRHYFQPRPRDCHHHYEDSIGNT